MDPIKNPYTPGAGTRPSELAGRDEQIDSFKVLLSRIRDGRPEQSQIVTGLRGVGKTVLLNTFEDYSESAGHLSAFRELTPESSLPELLSKDVQRLLRDLKLSRKLADAVRSGLSNLSAFKLTDPNGFVFSIDVRKFQERQLTDDFTELFLQLGNAAQQKHAGIVFFLDEIQFAKEAVIPRAYQRPASSCAEATPTYARRCWPAPHTRPGWRSALLRRASVPLSPHRSSK